MSVRRLFATTPSTDDVAGFPLRATVEETAGKFPVMGSAGYGTATLDTSNVAIAAAHSDMKAAPKTIAV